MPLTHEALPRLLLLLMMTTLASIIIPPNWSKAPGGYLHFISFSHYPASGHRARGPGFESQLCHVSAV